MRKTILIFFMCFGFMASHAQNRAVNKADNFFKSGKLAEAKEQIDMAAEHDKTKEKPKTWVTRGQVYGAIATAEDESIRNLASDPLEEAVKSYQKAMELEGKEESTGYIYAETQLEDLWGKMVNQGAKSYEAGEYEAALNEFEKALIVKPTDTLATFYAGVAAQNAGDIDEAVSYFYKYEEMGNPDEQIYNMLITYELSKENDEKALAMIEKAQNKFPENVDFTKHKYQILLKQGKTEEAIAGLEDAVKAEPNNPDLHYNIGALNEELKNRDAAVKAYEKALEIDPNHKNASYNLAVIYYDRAADLIREANELGISAADKKKHKELTTEADAKFKEALPYIEKAQSLTPEDRSLIQILMVAYDRTGQHKKADAMEKKLNSLPEQN